MCRHRSVTPHATEQLRLLTAEAKAALRAEARPIHNATVTPL